MALKAKLNASTAIREKVTAFKDGVTEDADIAATYLAETSSEAQEAIANSDMTPKQIAAIVRAIPGQGKEVDAMRVQALEDAADDLSGDDETETDDEGGDIAASSVESVAVDFKLPSARDFAAKFDKAALDAITEEVLASEKKKRGALPVLFHMVRTHGEEGMIEVPEPGTEEITTSADGKVTRHNRFEFYKRQVTEEGVKRQRNKSWFRDTFDLTPFGQSILSDLRGIADANKKLKQAPVQFKRMNPAERRAEVKKLTARQSDGVNLLRRAARVWHQMERFKLLDETVRWSWVAGTRNGGNSAKPGMDSAEAFAAITTGTTPFYIYEVGDTSGQNNDVVSITTFLSYDPETALANGGKWADLMETAGREGPGKEPVIHIPQADFKLEHVEQMATALVWWFDDGKRAADTYTLFRKGDNRKHAVLTFGELYGHIHNIWRKIEKDYDQFKQDELTADEAANSARVAQQRKQAGK